MILVLSLRGAGSNSSQKLAASAMQWPCDARRLAPGEFHANAWETCHLTPFYNIYTFTAGVVVTNSYYVSVAHI